MCAIWSRFIILSTVYNKKSITFFVNTISVNNYYFIITILRSSTWILLHITDISKRILFKYCTCCTGYNSLVALWPPNSACPGVCTSFHCSVVDFFVQNNFKVEVSGKQSNWIWRTHGLTSTPWLLSWYSCQINRFLYHSSSSISSNTKLSINSRSHQRNSLWWFHRRRRWQKCEVRTMGTDSIVFKWTVYLISTSFITS